MKNKTIRIIYFLGLFLLLNNSIASAQCAMCRATVESNTKTKANKIGSGLNAGILYLLATPYLAFAVVGFLWYRNSKKKHAKNI